MFSNNTQRKNIEESSRLFNEFAGTRYGSGNT